MKYKIAELEGKLLDAAVAKAEDVILVWENFARLDYSAINELDGRYYKPSIDGRIGTRIIERERIATFHADDRWNAGFELGCATGGVDTWLSMTHWQIGPTQLVAAMRAHVASKFGDEVDLP